MNKKIAVIIEDLFEDIEYSEPIAAFKKAGYKIINIGLKEGKIVNGKRHLTKVRIDEAVEDVSVSEFDALLVPGGYSPDRLRVNTDAINFVKDFIESGKPVFSICHAPQLLITAQVLKRRRITGWKSIVQDIKNAGAIYINQEVVEDNNLISSRNPRDLPAFIKKSLEKLQKS